MANGFPVSTGQVPALVKYLRKLRDERPDIIHIHLKAWGVAVGIRLGDGRKTPSVQGTALCRRRAPEWGGWRRAQVLVRPGTWSNFSVEFGAGTFAGAEGRGSSPFVSSWAEGLPGLGSHHSSSLERDGNKGMVSILGRVVLD